MIEWKVDEHDEHDESLSVYSNNRSILFYFFAQIPSGFFQQDEVFPTPFQVYVLLYFMHTGKTKL